MSVLENQRGDTALEQTTTEAGDSHPLPSGRDRIDDSLDWNNFVKELKGHWKYLWRTRIDDKVRAEGIASGEFPKLFVEKGTIIMATKDYRPPNFHEILKKYMPDAIADQVNPNPVDGGAGKFIREVARSRRNRRRDDPPRPKPKIQQHKHGGRGWMHHIPERLV